MRKQARHDSAGGCSNKPDAPCVLAPLFTGSHPVAAQLDRYEPMDMQLRLVHEPLPGPVEAEILQFPRTASSGRRLMVTIFGGSYSFFATGSLSGCFMRSISP